MWRSVTLLLCVVAACADEYHKPLLNRKAPENARAVTSVEEYEDEWSRVDVEDYHPKPARSCEGSCAKSQVNAQERQPSFWKQKAKAELDVALELQKREMKPAKNVIMFLGDGMGVPSITTGRILKGHMNDKSGADEVLAMDTFHHLGFAKSYNIDHQVPDSAGTATAYLTGVKTDLAVLGINAAVTPGNCESGKGHEVDSILVDSHRAGKSTGIVTTTRLNHATPGGAYAHSAYRYWYDDSDLPAEALLNGCRDIAFQLYDHSPNIQVLLGGGRGYFRPNTVKDPEYGTDCYRTDGQDLIEKWEQNMEDMGKRHKFVWRKSDFDAIDADEIDHLWGMFEKKDMNYEVDRPEDTAGEPSLTDMTRKAIEILQKNENGYFLLVEGGRIDHAHHGSNAYRAIHEVVEFDRAIEAALQMTSQDDTLIVATADHSHTFNFGGYPERTNPIFGLAGSNDDPSLLQDGKPYTSLLYGNGEGYQGPTDDFTKPYDRETLTPQRAGDVDYQQQSAVPLSSETHGGEDIPILAIGPMSHLFHTVHQQSYIAHAMRYASCVGENTELCDVMQQPAPTPSLDVEFLGYQLNPEETQTALNAIFGLEIAFSSAILMSIFHYLRH